MLFQQPGQRRQRDREDKIDGRHHGPDFEAQECLRDDGLAVHGQVVDGDGRDQGRVLDERDTLAGQGREDVAQGLGQDDLHVDARLLHAQAERPFPLSARDGQDACPDDFRGVGTFEQGQGQNRRGHPAQIHGRGQDEIDEEDLDQERRVADQFQISPGHGLADHGVR